MLEPGESARLSITALITPPIGSPATYSPPPSPGIGTIAGLSAIFLDLAVGSQFNPSPSGAGSWDFIHRAPGWALGSQGWPTTNGALTWIQAGQFTLPGNTANSANPINDIWQGVWTPASYSERNTVWQIFPGLADDGAPLRS
jgi:hypothetical protein